VEKELELGDYEREIFEIDKKLGVHKVQNASVVNVGRGEVAKTLIDNEFLNSILFILWDTTIEWKIGLSNGGLISQYGKVKGWSPVVFKAETTINCDAYDLMGVLCDMKLRKEWNPNYLSGTILDTVSKNITTQHWKFKRKRDMTVVVRRIDLPNGNHLFVARSLANKKAIPLEKGWTRIHLEFQIAYLIPMKDRTYFQFVEMINYSTSFHQPSSLKAKSLYRRIEILDGLLTVYGPDMNAGNNAQVEDDEEN